MYTIAARYAAQEVYEDNVQFDQQQDDLVKAYDLKMRLGGKAAEIEAALKMDPSTFTGTRLAAWSVKASA